MPMLAVWRTIQRVTKILFLSTPGARDIKALKMAATPSFLRGRIPMTMSWRTGKFWLGWVHSMMGMSGWGHS